jgi:hypothetical protein
MIVATLLVSVLAGCVAASHPKQPDESEREPINKTIPAEVQKGTE